ncbi:FBP domain-containing protein, partial [Leucobacter sp. M11]|uniref:FBP domain-containing protein n=1 Tax=Leucobacter sp. M11 TaxID=2993565 RepID=UPI002D7E1A54
MHALTSAEVRAGLRNASPREVSTLALPRGFDSIRWDRLDYLGWRDPRARQRGYLFTQTAAGPVGLILTAAAKTAGTRNRAVMCGLCQVPQRFDSVGLFTAPVSAI